jgi:hypothetical protein
VAASETVAKSTDASAAAPSATSSGLRFILREPS